MLPIIVKPAISPRQKAVALAVAGLVDLIQIGGLPFFFEGALSPLEDGLDFIAAVVLVGICGFKWQFIVGFFAELLPFVSIFPTWTMLVLTLPTERPAAAGAPVQVEQMNVAPPPPPQQARADDKSQVIDVDAVVVPPVRGNGA